MRSLASRVLSGIIRAVKLPKSCGLKQRTEAGIQPLLAVGMHTRRTLVMNKRKSLTFGTLAGLAVLLLGLSAQSQAQNGTLSSRVVGDVAARVFLDPSTGRVQFVGYFADVNGISASLFTGAPSEATAVLTFRSNVFRAQPLPANGDVALTLVTVSRINVYLNTDPNGDWGNPDSFSSGQLIATFERSGVTLLTQTGPTFAHLLSFKLASSRDFNINGKTLNLSQFVEHGLTLAAFGTNTPVPGIPGFSVGLPWGGYAIAVGSGEN